MARFALLDYNGKGRGLRVKLEEAGHKCVTELPVDAYFIDHDAEPKRVELIDYAVAQGARVFVYPHAGHPFTFYDGLIDPHPAVEALLVTAPGHVWLQESFGHARPVVEIGWFYCQQKVFQPTSVRNVLFAPKHPWADGHFMLDADRERNSEAYERVLALGVPVTVRYLGDFEANGLWDAPGVTKIEGRPDNSTLEIDQHDLTVSAETFACLAVARGKPTVMYAQDYAMVNDEGTATVRSWESYRDRIRYPYDLGDGVGVFERAASVEATEWRDEWIGAQLTTDRLPL